MREDVNNLETSIARSTLYQSLPPDIELYYRSRLALFHVDKELDVPAIKAKIERSAMLVFPIAVTTAKAHHGFGWVGEWRTPGESQIFQYLFTTGNYTAWVTGQVKI
ncbi:protein PSK SIMULATOR 3-like isoform X2 [Helianthus annuus]|uniref:protein PSK SIMULATOR 3-like isoform X2 n=1 Tax=Helianthus annuus TaxID=4232 RepID=UPI0016532F5B|nr:protein PSK SIMULATOR 3-like isoform X2 [Helianthus annuus]XP_035841496.1 protein PSK SIMULATOR 3-like isoform X2 [Helianthus annuus]